MNSCQTRISSDRGRSDGPQLGPWVVPAAATSPAAALSAAAPAGPAVRVRRGRRRLRSARTRVVRIAPRLAIRDSRFEQPWLEPPFEMLCRGRGGGSDCGSPARAQPAVLSNNLAVTVARHHCQAPTDPECDQGAPARAGRHAETGMGPCKWPPSQRRRVPRPAARLPGTQSCLLQPSVAKSNCTSATIRALSLPLSLSLSLTPLALRLPGPLLYTRNLLVTLVQEAAR